MNNSNVNPRLQGAGLCGCTRPSLRHERGCLWGLDRRKRPKGGLAAQVATLERAVNQLLMAMDDQQSACDQCGYRKGDHRG